MKSPNPVARAVLPALLILVSLTPRLRAACGPGGDGFDEKGRRCPTEGSSDASGNQKPALNQPGGDPVNSDASDGEADSARQTMESLKISGRITQRLNELINSQEGNVPQLVIQIQKEAKRHITDPVVLQEFMDRFRETFTKYEPPPPPPPDDPNKPPTGPQILPTVVGDLRREFANQMINANPQGWQGWSERGEANCWTRDYKSCYGDLNKAIERGANNPQTYATYSFAAHKLGDMDVAAQAAALALKMDAANKTALSVYNLSKGRESSAQLPSILTGAAGESLSSAAPGAGAGPVPLTAPASGGAMTAAQAAAEAARRANPSPSVVQQSAAMTRQAQSSLEVRDYSAAHSQLTKAIELNNSNAQAWNLRAIADNKLQRFNDAVYDASFSLALVPGNAPARQSRSWALNKQGKYREAMADATAILELEPDNAYAYQNLAYSLAGQGDRDQMLAALKRSAELDPRFQDRYERALQVPEKADVLFLFDDAGSGKIGAPEAPPVLARKKRMLMLSLSSVIGGILVALGILHIFSASWREKVSSTIRRFTGAPAGSASGSEGGSSFWGTYELTREIGLGGMGVVYEARDCALDRPVAIKKMRDEIRLDPRERARFMTEAKTVAGLHHPNIVDIYNVIEDGGEVYLVFEFVKGRTLADAVRDGGPMPFPAAARVLKHSCEAVEYAHRHKVIHRDLKPSNIMIAEDGTAKVMDFGVARQAKEALTKAALTNTVVGTPPYMAPEQEQGTVRPESDVYALGIIFYECLTGRLPFVGQGAGMLLNKINGKFTPLSEGGQAGLPPGLDAVMARVLHPDPDKRFHTPAELCAAVEALGPTSLV